MQKRYSHSNCNLPDLRIQFHVIFSFSQIKTEDGVQETDGDNADEGQQDGEGGNDEDHEQENDEEEALIDELGKEI